MFAKTADIFGASADAPRATLRNSSGSVLAADLQITGDVRSTGNIEVQGHVEGRITAEKLVITEFGHVRGNTTSQDIEILGQVDGSVISTRVKIHTQAKLSADISCSSLAIDSGAMIDGRITMTR